MASDSQKSEKFRVLVVEDDPEFGMVLRDFLGTHHYEITLLTNGADALRAILESDFDIIVCDMVMPQMPGDMFYKAVRRVKPRLCDRFIFVTGHAESPKVKEFLTPLSERVLKKPFHLDDLLGTIREVLEEQGDKPSRWNLLSAESDPPA